MDISAVTRPQEESWFCIPTLTPPPVFPVLGNGTTIHPLTGVPGLRVFLERGRERGGKSEEEQGGGGREEGREKGERERGRKDEGRAGERKRGRRERGREGERKERREEGEDGTGRSNTERKGWMRREEGKKRRKKKRRME